MPKCRTLWPFLVILAGFLAAWTVWSQPRADEGKPAADAPKKPTAVRHPVRIRTPEGPPLVASGKTDPQGRPLLLRCGTCHAVRKPNPGTRTGAGLKEFHQGLHYRHGDLTCLSCHNEKDYETLRLADGTPLPYARSMDLCGQCHGTQLRDYRRGAHGGMTGYWDLSKGPRQRNHCIDCHDPHAPAYPQVTPVFPPRDRFAPVTAADHSGDRR